MPSTHLQGSVNIRLMKYLETHILHTFFLHV
jgi:hypothetical protein